MSRPPYSLHEKIDVCRGVFALLVVVAHAFEPAAVLDPSWSQGMPRLLHDVLCFGIGTGIYYVMGFFILSGYCIQASIGRLGALGEPFPLRTYLVARATRIMPLYYAALAFVVAVEAAVRASGSRPDVWRNGIDGTTLVCQALLIQNFTQTFGSFTPSWSITNEFAYYVLFGLVAAACLPLGKRPAAVGMGVCVGVGMAMQVAYRLGMRHPVVLGTGLLFGLGAVWHLGALIAEAGPGLADRRRLVRLAGLWPLVLGLSMAMWISRRVHQEFVFVTAGVAFAMMLVRFVAADVAAGSPRTSRRLPYELGLVSYPMYLFHAPLLLAFATMVRRLGLSLPWWAVWAFGTMFAVGCCLPLGRLLESPTMAWRAGLLKRLKGRAPAPRPAALSPVALGVNR